MTTYQYTNLTSTIRDKASPIRQYLDRRYPNVKPLQADFRSRSGSIIVDGGDADPALMGSAFDLQLRFLLNPEAVPAVALMAFYGDRHVGAIMDVIAAASQACKGRSYGETLNRACWALALTTDVYRVGLSPESPLVALLRENRFSTSQLLALAPPDALRQMDELRALAGTQLRPHIAPPFVLGPTFDGSEYCLADADLIAGGMLLDVKTRLGTKNPRTGVRSDGLSLLDIYQILGYTLFDRSDRYHIDAVGIYSARYGSLIAWKLAEVLDALAGEPVNIEHERETVWRLLGGRRSSFRPSKPTRIRAPSSMGLLSLKSDDLQQPIALGDESTPSSTETPSLDSASAS